MTITSTTQSLPAYQEEYLKNLLSSAETLANQPTTIPDYQVADMTPAQRQAIELIRKLWVNYNEKNKKRILC